MKIAGLSASINGGRKFFISYGMKPLSEISDYDKLEADANADPKKRKAMSYSSSPAEYAISEAAALRRYTNRPSLRQYRDCLLITLTI